MARHTKRSIEPLKAAVESGKGIVEGLRAAGFPESVAQRGKAGLPKSWRGEIDRLQSLADKGRQYSAEQRAAIARGALLDSIDQGKDVVAAAKLVGADREVNLWVSEQNQAIVFVQPPQEWLEEFEAQRKALQASPTDIVTK